MSELGKAAAFRRLGKVAQAQSAKAPWIIIKATQSLAMLWPESSLDQRP